MTLSVEKNTHIDDASGLKREIGRLRRHSADEKIIGDERCAVVGSNDYMAALASAAGNCSSHFPLARVSLPQPCVSYPRLVSLSTCKKDPPKQKL